MAEQIFVALNFQTGQPITTIKQLKEQIKTLKQQISEKGIGTPEFNKLNDVLVKDQQTLANLNRQMKGTGTLSQGVAKGMVNSFMKVAGALGIAFSLGAIKNFASESIKAYQEQMASEAKLTTALGYRSQALLDQAKIQQKLTLIHDDEIIAAQAQLKIMGLTEQQILTLTPLMLDFAKSQGITATDAATKLGATLNGGRNALKKFGIELTGANGSTERLAQMTEGLTAKVGGQAEAWAKSQGEVARNSIAFHELKVAIGGVLIGSSGFLGTINDIVEGLADWIGASSKQSVKLEEEKFHLNALVASVTDVNIKQEDRLRLIKDIQKQYPDFLTNVKAEKITNEQLNTELAKVNANYDKKIKTMVLSEDLITTQKEGIYLYKKEQALIDELAKAKERGNKIDIFGTFTKHRGAVTIQYDLDNIRNLQKKNNKEATDLQLAYNKLIGDSEANNKGKPKELTEAEIAEIEKRKKAREEETKKFADEVNKQSEADQKAMDEMFKSYSEYFDKLNKLQDEEVERNREATNEKKLSAQQEITENATSFEAKRASLEAEKELAINNAKEKGESLQAVNKEYRDKEKALDKEQLQFENEMKNARLDVATSVFSGLSDLLSQDETNRKKYAGVLKVLAIGEILINLQRELSAISLYAALNPLNAMTAGIAGITQATWMRIGAVLRAGFGVAKVAIQKFSKGGILQGKSHAGGGIPFSVAGRGGFEAEGNEILLTKNVAQNSFGKKMASDLNSMFGGVKFAGGGIPQVSATKTSDNLLQKMIEGVGGIDIQPVVSVTEINKVQKRVKVIESNAKI